MLHSSALSPSRPRDLSLVLGDEPVTFAQKKKEKVLRGGVALFQVLLLLHAYSFAKSLLTGQETEEPKLQD